MKLSVTNPNNIVVSAFTICHTDKSLFSLYVNTVDRRIYPNASGYGSNNEFTLFFYSEDETVCEPDTVHLVPENEDEDAWLTGQRFESHCGDQLQYLFVAWEALDVARWWLGKNGCTEVSTSGKQHR